VYKDDLQGFLLAPDARRRRVWQYRRDSANWYRNFTGTEHNVDGVTVDWAAGRLSVPPGTTAAQQKVLREVLLRRTAPQTGRLAVYRREWFSRIIDRYRGTATQVIIFRLPRGPIPRPDWLVTKRSSSIRELAARPNVVLLDEHIFESLERPSLFQDPLHLNAKGMDLFSRMLAERVTARLRGTLTKAEHAVQ
jgi:lysophospholipase L1-like esterase